MLFLNLFSEEDLPVAEIVNAEPLFALSVNGAGYKQGAWPAVGKTKLEGRFADIEPYGFQQDMHTGAVHIYHSSFAETDYVKESTPEEVAELECVAIWDDVHVVERLLAVYDGAKSIWAEQLKIDIEAYERYVNSRSRGVDT